MKATVHRPDGPRPQHTPVARLPHQARGCPAATHLNIGMPAAHTKSNYMTVLRQTADKPAAGLYPSDHPAACRLPAHCQRPAPLRYAAALSSSVLCSTATVRRLSSKDTKPSRTVKRWLFPSVSVTVIGPSLRIDRIGSWLGSMPIPPLVAGSDTYVASPDHTGWSEAAIFTLITGSVLLAITCPALSEGHATCARGPQYRRYRRTPARGHCHRHRRRCG